MFVCLFVSITLNILFYANSDLQKESKVWEKKVLERRNFLKRIQTKVRLCSYINLEFGRFKSNVIIVELSTDEN